VRQNEIENLVISSYSSTGLWMLFSLNSPFLSKLLNYEMNKLMEQNVFIKICRELITLGNVYLTIQVKVNFNRFHLTRIWFSFTRRLHIILNALKLWSPLVLSLRLNVAATMRKLDKSRRSVVLSRRSQFQSIQNNV
jgi:hypothetical protein